MVHDFGPPDQNPRGQNKITRAKIAVKVMKIIRYAVTGVSVLSVTVLSLLYFSATTSHDSGEVQPRDRDGSSRSVRYYGPQAHEAAQASNFHCPSTPQNCSPCTCDRRDGTNVGDTLPRNQSQSPAQIVPLHVTSPVPYMADRGYIVAIRHYEQQTQGMRNFIQLQCFGHDYGLRSVEPFMEQANLGLPFNLLLKERREHLISLGDLMDIDLWNNQMMDKFGYKPMATWETFLKEAPRVLIVPCIAYRDPANLHVPPAGFNVSLDCPSSCGIGSNPAALSFLRKHGFKKVYTPCFNFVNFADVLISDDFMYRVLGKFWNQKVTVLIDDFRGFFGLYRLPVISPCGLTQFKPNITFHPSQRILKDTDAYIKNAINATTYVGVLIRIERLVRHLHHDITKCASKLGAVIDSLQGEFPGAKTFLGMDVGTFGSRGTKQEYMVAHGKTFVNTIFKGGWTFKEWDASFTKYITSTNAGYVANFQRSIVSQASCLVLVGGGGFQLAARKYYDDFHSSDSSICLRKVCM